MITLEQYFGDKEHPAEHEENARLLLDAVNRLLSDAEKDGVYTPDRDPDTGTQISGSKYGMGDGGYRTPDSVTGAPSSMHRSGNGVDVYEVRRKLVRWLDWGRLEKYGLYIEHPNYTSTWIHFQRIGPKSGNRVYIPYAGGKK